MDTLKFRSLKENPVKFYLESDAGKLEAYLLQKGLLESGDKITRVEKPGEGNMNMVLRVVPLKSASFIVKQARPWVEKYPEIEAPIERIEVEHSYYRYIMSSPTLSHHSPGILGFDTKNSLLVMEDLGKATDFSFVYEGRSFFNRQDLEAAINYLNNLKQLPVPAQYPSNLSLRKLNHQHIFSLPFSADNRFELDKIQAGLQQLSESCKRDQYLIKIIDELGKSYLETGKFLVHGDFYPGSLLNSAEGLKVIDPEFSFVGPEEWDIAIFTAHLFLSNTPIELIRSALDRFHKTSDFNDNIFAGYLGTEILRRLLGLAQVPVEMDLGQKAQLIEQSINWIKTGKIHTLSSYENNYLSD
jgi:5-methylthioribose kinase